MSMHAPSSSRVKDRRDESIIFNVPATASESQKIANRIKQKMSNNGVAASAPKTNNFVNNGGAP